MVVTIVNVDLLQVHTKGILASLSIFSSPFSFCDKRHWTFIASITLSTNVLLFGVNGYYNPFQYWCWIGLERFLNGWEQLLAKLIYCINRKLVDTQIFMYSRNSTLTYIMMIVSFNETIYLIFCNKLDIGSYCKIWGDSKSGKNIHF